MSDDSENTINETDQLIERVLTERGDEVTVYLDEDELRDAFVDDLRELVDEVEAPCEQHSEETPWAEMLFSYLVTHEREFLETVTERDPRYAPYVDDLVTRMEYDSSDGAAAEKWPFTLDEDTERDEGGDAR
jgi:hypothetical protein